MLIDDLFTQGVEPAADKPSNVASRVEVELRPLTLFFGYNSAGKSALIRALPLLRDSTRSDLLGPLDLDSETVRGALSDRGKVFIRFGPPNEIQQEAMPSHLAGTGTAVNNDGIAA